MASINNFYSGDAELLSKKQKDFVESQTLIETAYLMEGSSSTTETGDDSTELNLVEKVITFTEPTATVDNKAISNCVPTTEMGTCDPLTVGTYMHLKHSQDFFTEYRGVDPISLEYGAADKMLAIQSSMKMRSYSTNDLSNDRKCESTSSSKGTFKKILSAFKPRKANSVEEAEKKEINQNIADTNKKLNDIKSEVTAYNGKKSDTLFLNLSEKLNKIQEKLNALRNKVTDSKLSDRIVSTIKYSDSLMSILNERATATEERDNDIIKTMYSDITTIYDNISKNPYTTEESELIKKKLMNFLLSLDNVGSKESTAVKENYVATVRKVNDTLQLLQTAYQAIGTTPATSTSVENDNSSHQSVNVVEEELNANEELFNRFQRISKDELSDAISQFNDNMKSFGGLEKYICNVSNVKENALQLSLKKMEYTTKLLQLANDHMDILINEGKKYSDFNQSIARKSLLDIKSKGLEDLTNEQQNLTTFIDRTKGQHELHLIKLNAAADTIYSLMKPFVEYTDLYEEVHVAIYNCHDKIVKDLNNRRVTVLIDSLIKEYKCETNAKHFGIVYNPNLKQTLENMKSVKLREFRNIMKGCIHCILINKLSQNIDTVIRSLVATNHELWKKEEEKLESYISETQMLYKTEMSNEIISLGYLPDSEEIDKFHQNIFSRSLKSLSAKCSDLKISINETDIRNRFKQKVNSVLGNMKENVALKKFHQRKTMMEASNQFNYAVGIDLGTTFSCVTVYKNGTFEEIKNFNDLRTIPSAVYVGSTSTIVGNEALIKGLTDPANLIHGVKRIIGRTYNEPEVESFISSNIFKVDKSMNGEVFIYPSNGSKFKPEEISAKILKELKQIAEHHLKNPVNDAVVTIPAYFNEPQRRATLEACKRAGLNVLRLLNEPTAAAFAYGFQHQCDISKNVLVFDFGGGTCDVSILEISGKKFHVKASYGDNSLGGLDFDRNLMNYVVERLETQKGLRLNDIGKRRILKECERVKKVLSEKLTANIYLAEIANGVELKKRIQRSTFVEINEDLFERALKTVKNCLKSASLSKYEIHDIVLAGGSSHIPKMQQDLRAYFGNKKLECKINPDEAISYGAALQAAILTGECKEDFQLREITPFSLGTDIIGDRYSVIIPKNSEIPCTATERYKTTIDYQNRVSVKVFQGENDFGSLNSFLGKFVLEDITIKKAGETKLDVIFKIDENGILTVTAVEVGNEYNRKTIVIERNVT